MKKALALILFLLAACNSTQESDVSEPSGEDVPLLATSSPAIVAESVEVQSVDSFTPAKTIEEAAVLREQDHVRGAAEPVVAIIEYGDYQ